MSACYCSAYPFPHRPSGGKCRATGETACPNCGAILADDQVQYRLWATETHLYPADYAPVVVEECGRCGVSGMVV